MRHLAHLLVIVIGTSPLMADNWPGFRGPQANGISADTKAPLNWSETNNLAWKTTLPGPGSSSPIVWEDRVYVTCYSGYGLKKSSPGQPEDLKRHLICIDRLSGKILWEKIVPAILPEDQYRGFISEHGYASSTPVTDGQHIYVFFGKTGVLAFDMAGELVWQKSVGTDSSNRKWGSSSSPILYQDLLLVNASEESVTLFAFDKKTGKEIWKTESPKLELTYATPVIVKTPKGSDELIVAVPNEIWGFDPLKGTCTWWAHTDISGNICPTLIAGDGMVFVTGGHPVGSLSLALRLGGEQDITDSHIAWTSKNSSYVPSLVTHQGHLYWVSDSAKTYCLEVKTGKVVYKEQLDAPKRMGFYGSVVLAGNRLYAVSRKSGTYVLAAQPTFEQLAHNTFPSDESDFNSSPAIVNGQILIRSNTTLYCVETKP